ncbi:CHAP domain-containing protein, partial [Pseudomonas aeruginosa]
LISDSNIKGLGVVSYRTFDAETAKQIPYVIGH